MEHFPTQDNVKQKSPEGVELSLSGEEEIAKLLKEARELEAELTELGGYPGFYIASYEDLAGIDRALPDDQRAQLENPSGHAQFEQAVADHAIVEVSSRTKEIPREAREAASTFSLATELTEEADRTLVPSARPPRATLLKRLSVFTASVCAALAIDGAVSNVQAQTGEFSWNKVYDAAKGVARGVEEYARYEREMKDLRVEQDRLTSEYGKIMADLGIQSATESAAGAMERKQRYDAEMDDLNARELELDASFGEISNPSKSDSLRYRARKLRLQAEKKRLAARRGIGTAHRGDAHRVSGSSENAGARVQTQSPTHEAEVEIASTETGVAVDYAGTGEVRDAGRAMKNLAELERRRGELEARLSWIENRIQELRVLQATRIGSRGIDVLRDIGR
jgi:hypothetical protein